VLSTAARGCQEKKLLKEQDRQSTKKGRNQPPILTGHARKEKKAQTPIQKEEKSVQSRRDPDVPAGRGGEKKSKYWQTRGGGGA